jgi:type I restriction enzyme S subunit
MAGDWATVELGEVAAVRSGYAFKSSDWKDVGIPVVKIANVKGGRLEMSGCSFVSESTAAETGEFQLSAGDILIAMTGYIGDVARVRKTDLPCVLNQRVGKFSVRNEERLDADFLYTFLSWAETRQTIEGLGYGSAQANVSPSLIHKVNIPLPPIAEQKAIAAVLGALDNKIELNRRMNATLEAMARALFQSWFVDFDPVRAKLDGRQPVGLDPATAALFPDSFQDSDAGNIPNGWEVAKLKDLTSKIGSGATPRGGSEVYVEEGPALIRSQNVYDYEFRWAGLARLTDKSAEELKNVEVMKNDVLLNITGDSILRTCVVDPEALPARVNQHVAIIRAINGIPANYLHFYLVQESMKTFLIGMSAGATRHAITKGHLESIDVLKPSALVLKAFEQRTTPWFAQIDANRSQSRTLATLRDMLLPKLLSGELKAEGFTV